MKKISNAITAIINVLALMVSWYFNKSILWAIFHFFFGGFYLIYRLIIGSFRNGGLETIINSYF
tara:strand:- start:609 stop:800 length:192 start_codon:yes stop_codon:yes gene_type:complete